MARKERDILERAVHSIAERASQASAVVDEAYNAGLDGTHPVTLQAKMLRLELLNAKADLERELGRLVLHCTACGQPLGSRPCDARSEVRSVVCLAYEARQ
jgi:hypothetical protein